MASQKDNVLVATFMSNGLMTASDLADRLSLSQTMTFRMLQRSDVVKIGKARRTRYGLVRNLRGLGSAWPIYEIDEKGNILQRGKLYALYGGFYYKSQQVSIFTGADDGFYESLPWFLADHRLQGFIGRNIVQNMESEMGIQKSLKYWDDDDILEYFIRWGSDISGAFIVGDAARERFLNLNPAIIYSQEKELKYQEHLKCIMNVGQPGSSVAGEQPKFSTILCDENNKYYNTLVKYSGLLSSDVGRRWGDLLMAEYCANIVLEALDVKCANTNIFETEQRVYLECERIDRDGKFGRKNICTLESIDAEFLGKAGMPWPEIMKIGVSKGIFSKEDAQAVNRIHEFGRGIGNNDMHLGNLSFKIGDTFPFELAPIYDMLPMLYAPRSDGSFLEKPLTVKIADSKIRELVRDYWVMLHEFNISNNFRNIVKANADSIF